MDRVQQDAARSEYELRRSTYVTFSDSIRSLIGRLVSSISIETDSITSRAKDVVSLAEKLKRKSTYGSLADVPDLVGVRVVTRYQGDVLRVCDHLATEFRVLEDVTHGGEEADAFGYASRHLVVELVEPRAGLPEWVAFAGIRAEIQVRSILQHAWASISHGLDYKTGSAVPQEVRRQLFRVAALLETGDELFDDFRNRVSALRETYSEDVSKNEWGVLPLNLDSLLAAYDKLHFGPAAAAAVSAGWLPYAEDPDATDLQNLVSVSTAAGLKTVGDLALVVDRVARERSWLESIAGVTYPNGFKPSAVSTDVALLHLVALNPGGAVREAAEETRLVPELVEAARLSLAV